MKVVKVVPIARAIKKDNLHYFTADNVQIGDFLEAPLRSKNITVKVLEVVDPKDLKTELKSSDFTLKKAKKINTNSNLSSAFVESAEETAEYFGSFLGAVLESIIPPKQIFNELIKISANKKELKVRKSDVLSDTMVFQAQTEDRMSAYKSLIREKFAQNKSILFVLPTSAMVNNFYEKIKIGLDAYTFLFNTEIKKTELLKNWKVAVNNNHPIIVVSTPAFVFIPRDDFGTIIIEEESSRFYKKDKRPFVDFRFFIERFGNKNNSDLIFADSMIRTEQVYRLNTHQISEYRKPSFRILFDNQAKISLFPNKEKKDDLEFGLSKELIDLIKYSIYHEEKLLIYVPRKGLSPITFCADCFSPQKCPKCESYLGLKIGKDNKPENRIFKCNNCDFEKSAKSRCGVCDSWNLKSIYSGIDGIAESVQGMFPDLKVLKYLTEAKKESKTNLENFLKDDDGVIVGTEGMLNQLSTQIDNVAVLSVESLFFVPEYKVSESAIGLLIKLRALANSKFLIQGTESNDVLQTVISGNLSDFYNLELKQREILRYPPFTVLFSITCNETKKNLEILENLKEDLAKYKITEHQKKLGRKNTVSLFGKIPAENYPDPKFSEIVKNLPLDFSVEINPNNLFR